MEASSSSAPSFPCSYDVFLSFRGKDTRTTFTDHLYIALTQAGIHTFRDDDEIERGEDIKRELEKAIQQSKVAVIVLSPEYASSRWCLDELVEINERRKAGHGHIIPIFYHIDPYVVRRQRGSFGEAFARHEDRYKEQLYMVEKWKDTLKEVADLSGEVLKDCQQHEGRFIQNIVKLVMNKLSSKLLHVDSQLFGTDSYVKKINLWLQDEPTDVRILIVYGIGGVGKTTIAKTVFNQNYRQFERSCFLANVRETSEQPKGVHRLQKQLLLDMGRSEKIYNTDQGVVMIRDSICCRKVLIVIDDIDELKQFRQIIGRPEWLSSGSKIIITTRRKSLFNDHESFWNLNIKPLDDHNSLQLFNFHAFGGDSVPGNLVEYSKYIVSYCGGLPLALSVLGSFLSSDKSIDLWRSALKELQAIPKDEVQKILEISYDSLENDSHQQLFLHIACFFIGMDQDFVIDILDGCGFQTKVGIKHLSDRCLITINQRNEVEMHQLVRDMGREIVRKESDEPGKRSRVWKNVEAFQVLTERTGTETIKGLIFDLQMLKEDEHVKATSNFRNNSADMQAYQDNCLMFCSLGSFFLQLIMNCIPAMSSTSSDVIKIEAFARMRKLQILQLNNVEFEGGFKNFPKCLVWLRWHRFLLEYIPTSLRLEKLVVLDMRYSGLRHVFQGRLALQERGILSIFQGGCEIPGWYTYQGEGSSISFVLDTCDEDYEIIYGLNICVVFEAPNDLDDAEVESLKQYQPFLLVKSRDKCITWAYGPAFYPLRMRPLGMESTSSGTCTDMLWLSFWKFFNQLEHGDEVTVRVLMPPSFVVKRVCVYTVGVDEIHPVGTIHPFWYYGLPAVPMPEVHDSFADTYCVLAHDIGFKAVRLQLQWALTGFDFDRGDQPGVTTFLTCFPSLENCSSSSESESQIDLSQEFDGDITEERRLLDSNINKI